MWGIDEDSLYKTYLPKAREILREQAKEMLAEPIEAKVLRVYYKAMKDGKYQTALACLSELNRMSGNYAPAKARLEINDWRSKAIQDIQAGLIAYDALAEAFDEQTAKELFTLAGRSDDVTDLSN
jgi:hypothetical protein